MLLMIEKPRSTLAERTGSALRRGAVKALTLLDAVVLWPFRVGENRRLLQSLASMSDHHLRDIGLTRQDLRDSTALPAGADAGRFFAARRGSRRR